MSEMDLPTGAGNYPPGVTDNDPYFTDETECDDEPEPPIYECPWCLTKTQDIEHMRRCSGYQTPLSREEILDAYSDPTDAAKRERFL